MHAQLHVYNALMTTGNLDELNSHFGLVREYVKDDPCLDDIKSDLYELQCLLLELGTHVASPSIDPEKVL